MGRDRGGRGRTHLVLLVGLNGFTALVLALIGLAAVLLLLLLVAAPGRHAEVLPR